MGGSEFDYSDEYDEDGKPAKVVENQPHDEEVTLASDGDDSSMGSPGGGGADDGDDMRGTMNHGGDSPPQHASEDEGLSDDEDDMRGKEHTVSLST